MELIEGRPLKGPIPLTQTLKLAIQIAEAVSDAHRHGIIHRDLKPSNILVTKSGAKILDFGFAKVARSQAAARQGQIASSATRVLTQDGTVLGTPQYMSPEQIEGQEADARTDIFAFGLVLYEMLTGQPAFKGKTPASLIAAILGAEPAPVSSLQPLVPRAVDHLVRTCLAKDPDQRQQSIHDVLLQLRCIEENLKYADATLAVAQRSRREWMAWSLAGACTAGFSAVSWLHSREQRVPAPVIRFQFTVPEDVRMSSIDTPAISPDGSSIFVPGFTK